MQDLYPRPNWNLNLKFFRLLVQRIHLKKNHLCHDPQENSRGLHTNPAALNSTLCSPDISWKDCMFWNPQRPAKHFFSAGMYLLYRSADQSPYTQLRGDGNLLPADRGRGTQVLSGHCSPCYSPSLPAKDSVCPGVRQKAGRPRKENSALCLHITIPSVCVSFQMQTENLTNFTFLSKLPPFKFLHINSD